MKVQAQWLGVDEVRDYFGGRIGRDRARVLMETGIIKNATIFNGALSVHIKDVIEFDEKLKALTEPATFDVSRHDKNGKLLKEDFLIITPIIFLNNGGQV